MGYNYSSVARATELSEAVTGSATLLKVSSVTGLPTVPFTVVVDVATESEEILTVTGVAGLNLTVMRGQDGTAAVPHQVGAVVRHMAVGRDFRQAQDHIDAASNVHGLAGGAAVVGTSSAQTITNKTISGASNTFQAVPGSVLNDGTVVAAKLGTGAVTTAKISDANVTTAKIADAGVTTPKIADANVTTPKIADASVTTAKIGDSQVTAAKIVDGGVGTAELADGAVTPAKVVGRTVRAVADGTAATALETAETPTASAPLVVWNQSTNRLQVSEGTGFFDQSGVVLGRYPLVTLSGSMPAGTLSLASSQTIPAAPFGESPYQLRVSASIRADIPAGLGFRLRLLYDGVTFAESTLTNSGGTQNTMTLYASNVAYVNNPASDTTHVLVAQLTALSGTILNVTGGWWSIEAQARGNL